MVRLTRFTPLRFAPSATTKLSSENELALSCCVSGGRKVSRVAKSSIDWNHWLNAAGWVCSSCSIFPSRYIKKTPQGNCIVRLDPTRIGWVLPQFSITLKKGCCSSTAATAAAAAAYALLLPQCCCCNCCQCIAAVSCHATVLYGSDVNDQFYASNIGRDAQTGRQTDILHMPSSGGAIHRLVRKLIDLLGSINHNMYWSTEWHDMVIVSDQVTIRW